MTLYHQPVDLIDFLSSCKILLGVGLGYITDSLGGGSHLHGIVAVLPVQSSQSIQHH